MALTAEDFELIGAYVSKLLAERDSPIGIDGTIIGGSWDPKTGTALVIRADTASIIPNGYDLAAYATRVPLHTPSYCQQYGVVGNERVTMYETQSGPAAMLKFDEDDSIGAKAGEHVVAHRNASGAFDVTSTWSNDGPTANDGLGGLSHIGGALHLTQTKNGLSTRYDDTAGQIKQTAAANTYILLDSTGAIHHVAPSVGVGDKFSNLDSTRAAFANADATTLATNIKKAVGNALQQAAQAAITAGVTNASTWLTTIQSGLPSLSFTDLTSSVASIAVPSGSATVRIKQ